MHVVFGASGGIGNAVVRELARQEERVERVDPADGAAAEEQTDREQQDNHRDDL